MRKSNLNSVVLVCMFVFTLMSGVAAATPARVEFYDIDNTKLLMTFNFDESAIIPASSDSDLNRSGLDSTIDIFKRSDADGGGYYLSWKALNKVPDYSKDESTVILTWAEEGQSERCVLSDYAARPFVEESRTRTGLKVLQEDKVLKLVPLKTMSKSEFDKTAYLTTTVDTHTDSPSRMLDSTTWRPVVSNDLSNSDGRSNVAQGLYAYRKAGGSTGMLHAAFNGGYPSEDFSRGAADRAISRTLALLNATHWSAARHPNDIQLVTKTSEFASAFAADKIGIMQSIESAYSLTDANCEELLDQFYDLGVRMLSFTWNYNSYLAAGNLNVCRAVDGVEFTPEPKMGLTALGKRALTKMRKIGMVFDVSHTDDQTIRDALDFYKDTNTPIIGSHSGARSVFDHERNLWDPEILAMAQQNNGVISQNFYGDFIAEPRSMYQIIDQIDYIVKILNETGKDGTDYVGIGTDFDGGTNNADANDARYVFRFVKELFARGYTAAQIEKIRWQNVCNIIDTVQGQADAEYKSGNHVTGSAAVISSPTASGVALTKGQTWAQLNTREPEFSATVTNASSGRVIVDGIVYESTLKDGVLSASLAGQPLQESFHVVTFEATDSSGKVTRDTKIFDLVEVPLIHKVELLNPNRTTNIATIYIPDGESLNKASLPQNTSSNQAITGWEMYWTKLAFTSFDEGLTRSFRLVATVDGASQPTTDSDDDDNGGCQSMALPGVCALIMLLLAVVVRRAKA